jgi:hypothetical protein
MQREIWSVGFGGLFGVAGGLLVYAIATVAHAAEVAAAEPPGLMAEWSNAGIAIAILTPVIVAVVKALRMVLPVMAERAEPVPPAHIGRTTRRAKGMTIVAALAVGCLGGFFIEVPSSFPNHEAFRFVLGGFAGLSAIFGHHVATLPFSARRKDEKAAKAGQQNDGGDPTKTGTFGGLD